MEHKRFEVIDKPAQPETIRKALAVAETELYRASGTGREREIASRMEKMRKALAASISYYGRVQ